MVKDLMWGNKLCKGELKVGGREVKLENIKAPLLHVMAEHDHVAPYDATKVLVEMVGSEDKEAVVMKGGHVSVFAGGGAVKRMWPKLDSWLAHRSI
jgi:polyhydroxyalkanoate synthase